MGTDIINAINLKAAKKEATETLGAIVWWSLDGVEVLMEDCKAAATAAGFEAKDVCPNIETRGAVGKALESLGLKAGTSGLGKGKGKGKKKAGEAPQATAVVEQRTMFYRRLRDDATSIAFNIVEEVRQPRADGSVDASYVERQQIVYDRKSKALEFSTDFLRDRIRLAFAKYGETYRANEVRICIMNVLDACQAIIVRESGGVYFVPRTSLDVLARLQTFCGQVHANAKLTKLSILDVAGERKDMQVFAHAAIKGELDKLAADIEAIQAREGETSVRDSTLERRLADYKRLREKARCYKDLLAIQTGEVEGGLRDLTAKVEKMLMGDAAA